MSVGAPPPHGPASAPPELLVLREWEETTAWLLRHTARWPRSWRFTLCARVQNLALDIADLLVQARFQPNRRAMLLEDANLSLERMGLPPCVRIVAA